jgi:hypothetical protein
MAKKGMRNNDAHGTTSGRNNPKQSMEITAGTPKKREPYAERAREHKDPEPVAQHARAAEATRDHRDGQGTRIHKPGSRRGGSESGSD